MTPPALPARARVVIIGGGVIGTSIAYHLALTGETDVVLLERDRLTSGTTWHAAGLMTTFGSTSETNTRNRLYSRDLFARLEADTGVATGFKPVGLIEAAADADRLEEYRRVAAFQRHLGLEVHEITPKEMSELFPLAKTDDLLAGFYVPGDGRVNPVDLTMSFARGARQRGVRVLENVPVIDVLTRPRGRVREVVGVRTAYGDIECDRVVNCAGMWARELGERSGVIIPNQAAEHYYLITEPIDGLSPDAPVFEDPAAYGYYREEGGGMMVGLFEPSAAAWRVDGIPADFSFGEITPDWDRMGPFVERAMARVPATLDVGIRTFFCGPESFLPDLAPAVGEAPGIRGYFVCAGMNSVGILSSGGLGRVMAHWITTGHPDVDTTGFNVDRFQAWQLDPGVRRARTAEILGTVYAAHTPGVQLRTARGIHRSPVHDEMVAAGAYLRDVSGWESADWYADPAAPGLSTADPSAHPSDPADLSAPSTPSTPGPAGPPPAGAGDPDEVTPGWGPQPWFRHWAAEHHAVRTAVGLFDMSFMAKFQVTGRGAGAMLARMSAGAVDGPADRVTYTQWLREDGRIVADLTVTKRGADDFLVVASDTAHAHVAGLLDRAIADADVTVTDVTHEVGMLSLQGPRSRDVLQRLTDTDVSHAAFPFRTARSLTIGGRRVLVQRITYVGELGYELYPSATDAPAIWAALREEGAAYGLRPCGLKALSSLRLEKGYRDFGHDIDDADVVPEVGLDFAVARAGGDFIGREAYLAQRLEPARRRLVSVLLDDPEPLLYHAEVVRRDGVAVGYLRSGSYGWTLGGAVGLASVAAGGETVADGAVEVDHAWIDAGQWRVDVAGREVPARVSLRPFYDPTSARVRS
ncbi:MAG: GcvT family protein [Tetrasphaera sp.]|nr:GcvT family protein [Tetrasphaera sp.]